MAMRLGKYLILTTALILAAMPAARELSIFDGEKFSYVSERSGSRGEETTLLFVGDIMMSRAVEKSVINKRKGDFNFLFEKAGFIKEADLAFGNLEGPVSDKGKDIGNLYSFRMRPESLDAAKDAGFDAFSIANNHMADWGPEAFTDTVERLKEKGILFPGGGANRKEAVFPQVKKVNGLSIGFLAFSDKGPRWLEAGEEKPGILTVKEDFADIVAKSAEKTDVLIVSFHFGEEYESKHNSRQEFLARSAIDNGAKIVIGHHPHVIQDTEFYKDGFIAYSLGNFIFDQTFSEETMTGMALHITLNSSGAIKFAKQTEIKINRDFQPELEPGGSE
ncbi:CapA family protein [Candidatus Parcubacteria bacterium]|nr:MAG: CapA family protein [Candidatus Parcubacteria bacterium]